MQARFHSSSWKIKIYSAVVDLIHREAHQWVCYQQHKMNLASSSPIYTVEWFHIIVLMFWIHRRFLFFLSVIIHYLIDMIKIIIVHKLMFFLNAWQNFIFFFGTKSIIYRQLSMNSNPSLNTFFCDDWWFNVCWESL